MLAEGGLRVWAVGAYSFRLLAGFTGVHGSRFIRDNSPLLQARQLGKAALQSLGLTDSRVL